MISCNQHDYIEIACLYHLPLKLMMKNGDSLEGIAIDTVRDQENRECILIEENWSESMIILDELLSMQAMKANPHFEFIQFNKT